MFSIGITKIRHYGLRRTRPVVLDQKKEYWQFVLGGLAVIVLARVADYSIQLIERANKHVEEGSDDMSTGNPKQSNDVPYGQEDSESYPGATSSTPNRPNSPIKQALGVDMGTSFSRVSYRNNEVIEVVENREGKRATATALHSSDSDSEVYIGQLAIKNRWMKPAQTAYGAQLFVGLKGSDPAYQLLADTLPRPPAASDTTEAIFTVGSRYLTASACCAVIARELIHTASGKTHLISRGSQTIPSALTVPVFFSSQQTQAMLTACRGAGLNCVTTVQDPVCAVLGAMNTKTIKPATGPVLVVDFGGRVVQTSVVECKASSGELSEVPVVASHHTLFDLGGEYIDEALVNHIASNFARENGIDLLADPMAVLRLYEAAESAKFDLSGGFTTKIELPYITADSSGAKHLILRLSRSQFEAIIASRIDPLCVHVKRLRDTATSSLTAVLLVGGGARMPIVKNSVLRALNLESSVPIVTGLAPEELVCIGAAAYTKFL
mmetsp:Transcript_41154/g.42053  ORF Transcript_41154/g.42053 Transcript_41154/m.42053 type:complete len:495 (+) Transcript_41154:252-1736(+)|eukprot:CAMPEP_0182417032 /NCGR_PEP_ID=MMETSP1167-20130531/1462_1 /TAXON_ID=2988 /ORGANISM="Mallomonas Sp, Strain CCMP3275" /LENGTH=494 /DNA_ID=CAMNT_0024590303 /DNA_START=202 /DNA_END=1686 /DNA_ORIENTATION=-